MVFAIVLSFALLIWILAPFWHADDTPLLEAAVVDDPEILLKRKEKLLTRYLEEERQFQRGEITPREWRSRQQFLTNRYVDLVNRLDFLAKA